jgi:hypothetical protein
MVALTGLAARGRSAAAADLATHASALNAGGFLERKLLELLGSWILSLFLGRHEPILLIL